EYHPAFAVLILIGWFLFARNYFACVGFSLRHRPVYIYMWTVGIPLFVYAFLEGRLYVFEFLSNRPLRDLAIQWKSNGVLVGSFNQIIYGALMYISCRMQGDDRYAYSRTAFSLFLVGVLNTFTNYGHHTFHLPQSPWIHWISFLVSMLEAIILAKVFVDLLVLRKAAPATRDVRVPVRLIRFATAWTCFLLILALAISIPPLNALIHGTYVVVAHAMGSMIAIDSLILWATLAYLLQFVVGAEHPTVAGARVYAMVPLANLFLLVFLGAFMARGISAGWTRYLGPSAPEFSLLVESFPTLIVLSGAVLTVILLWMIVHWAMGFWVAAKPGGMPVLTSPESRSLTETEF
ncbi:MAG: cbb3-type cytochrome c oxidase subunit I, partial [Candidatus Tectomicrobia bacterium]|nr:cbb3-type cytochrome c oxidase subunit I [Candidatus Tectomicrobia bacterium]